jgi:hypothetical protein
LRSGAVRDGRRRLLRGETFDAHPVEAEYLASSGAASPIEPASLPAVRSTRGGYETAAKLGPVGR